MSYHSSFREPDDETTLGYKVKHWLDDSEVKRVWHSLHPFNLLFTAIALFVIMFILALLGLPGMALAFFLMGVVTGGWGIFRIIAYFFDTSGL